MTRWAVKLATMGFFALAGFGAASGQAPFDCAWRGLAGAAAIFVLATVAGRIVIEIIASAVVRQIPHASNTKDASRERAN
jgi:hypothetical protein